MTSEFPAQKASNAENAPIWWRHHVVAGCLVTSCLSSDVWADAIVHSTCSVPHRTCGSGVGGISISFYFNILRPHFFQTFSHSFSWMQILYFDWNFTGIYHKWSNWLWFSIGPSNGLTMLTPNRWQDITWTGDNQVYWPLCVTWPHWVQDIILLSTPSYKILDVIQKRNYNSQAPVWR